MMPVSAMKHRWDRSPAALPAERIGVHGLVYEMQRGWGLALVLGCAVDR